MGDGLRLDVGNLRLQCPTCGVPVDVVEAEGDHVLLEPCEHRATVAEDDSLAPEA